jgi:hypothetical protein
MLLYLPSVLSADDLAMLRECEEEYARRGHFQRIFPTPFNIGHYRKYIMRFDKDKRPEGGIPRADLLLWEWLQLRYFMTCGSDRAFEHRDLRRVRRRMRYLNKKKKKKQQKKEKKEGLILGIPSEWQKKVNGGGRTPRTAGFGYYCGFCDMVHYDDPIQVWL